MHKLFSFNKSLAGLIGLAVGGMLLLPSCNKTFDNTLKDDYGDDISTVNKGTRKTLLIVVDGAIGTEVRAAAPPNLNGLADFSIFSWDGLADFKKDAVTNSLGWSNLLTGVGSDKHNVTGSDFAGNHIADYPSIFTRLKEQKPEWRTSAFCSSPGIVQWLAADATEKNSFAENDGQVKDAVKAELSTKDPVLVLAQFHEVDKAGEAGSYSVTDAAYKSAILKTDEYIGEILTALRARATFKDENWMVVITSGKGSNIAADPAAAARNAYDDSRRNTFFFCYNPRFNSLNPTKPGTVIPYIGSTPLYDGENDNSISRVLDGGATYDFGATGSYTIQCKVKIPPNPNGLFYPAFLGKRASFDGGVVGWVFFLEGDIWQINFGQSGSGNIQVAGSAIADDNWHTLTAVIKQEGSDRNVYTYTDGVYSGNSRNISGLANINSPAPLAVGSIPGSRFGGYLPVDYFVTDVRIYNTALEDAYIAGNFCKTNIEPSDPYAGNVLGFWPCTSVSGDKKMKDLGPNNHDMVVNQLNAVSFSELSVQICPQISDEVYKTVPNAVDIAIQVYQWFGIIVPPSWNLDGKNWIPTYSDING